MAGMRPGPGPTSTFPVPHTHIKGFTKGVTAAKDWVGDGDQGWAGPFLPRGEVIISVIFCLRRGEW